MSSKQSSFFYSALHCVELWRSDVQERKISSSWRYGCCIRANPTRNMVWKGSNFSQRLDTRETNKRSPNSGRFDWKRLYFDCRSICGGNILFRNSSTINNEKKNSFFSLATVERDKSGFVFFPSFYSQFNHSGELISSSLQKNQVDSKSFHSPNIPLYRLQSINSQVLIVQSVAKLIGRKKAREEFLPVIFLCFCVRCLIAPLLVAGNDNPTMKKPVLMHFLVFEIIFWPVIWRWATCKTRESNEKAFRRESQETSVFACLWSIYWLIVMFDLLYSQMSSNDEQLYDSQTIDLAS